MDNEVVFLAGAQASSFPRNSKTHNSRKETLAAVTGCSQRSCSGVAKLCRSIKCSAHSQHLYKWWRSSFTSRVWTYNVELGSAEQGRLHPHVLRPTKLRLQSLRGGGSRMFPLNPNFSSMLAAMPSKINSQDLDLRNDNEDKPRMWLQAVVQIVEFCPKTWRHKRKGWFQVPSILS